MGSSNFSDHRVLLANIGGTNARFATYDPVQGNVDHFMSYKTADYDTLALAASQYLKDKCAGVVFQQAAFAVAAPVSAGVLKFSNSPWEYNPIEMSEIINIERRKVLLCTDFHAAAAFTTSFSPSDITPLRETACDTEGTKTILGPGTGLGHSSVYKQSDGDWLITDSQLGHSRFAPQSEQQQAIVSAMPSKFVRVEDLLSGRGLVNIYQSLIKIDGQKVQDEIEPAGVVSKANSGDDFARQTTDIFSAILGGFAQNAALVSIPYGGVFFTGGVTEKLEQAGLLNRNALLDGFNNNPAEKEWLQRIPLHLVNKDPVFHGLVNLHKMHSTPQ